MSTAELTDEVVEFLSAGTRTGKIAWVSKDGRALVTPIWFIVEDGALVFNTGENTSKGRALQRDPRAAIVVDDERPRSPSFRYRAPSPSTKTPPTSSAPPQPSPRDTWATTSPNSSGHAMPYRARLSFGSHRRRSLPRSTSPTERSAPPTTRGDRVDRPLERVDASDRLAPYPSRCRRGSSCCVFSSVQPGGCSMRDHAYGMAD